MDPTAHLKLQAFLKACLSEAGDQQDFADDSSLFVSGRLDSLAMTRLVMFLEDTFQIDFGEVDFDVDLIDSVNDMRAFVEMELARRAC